jgi:hypothetical protein
MNDSAKPLKRQSSEPPADESPSHRQKLHMSLESVADDLDDATHFRMDKAVLKVATVEPSIPYLAASLLCTIVSLSEKRLGLDPKYKKTPEAVAFLKEHPEVTDMLKDAWRAGAFKTIRNLSA